MKGITESLNLPGSVSQIFMLLIGDMQHIQGKESERVGTVPHGTSVGALRQQKDHGKVLPEAFHYT